jgi:hypothetical protein
MTKTRAISLLFLLFSCFVHSQKRDTTYISVDASMGIKKTIHYERFGTGGGYSGSGAALTKRTITKYNKEGKIIYLSHHTYRLRGCIGSVRKWDIISYEQYGAYKTLKRKSRGRIIIKSYDKEHKLLSRKNFDSGTYTLEDWIDKDDSRSY